MKKILTIGLMISLFFVPSLFGNAGATLINDDMSIRVKGTSLATTYGWEIALGDEVKSFGSYLSATGPDTWLDAPYSFRLNYNCLTGIADFQVSGTNFTSSLLISPDYDIKGYGFTGITLGLVRQATTGLNVSNLVLNKSSISDSYEATTRYTNYSLYSGSILDQIVLTGEFKMMGDFMGNNGYTRFDLNLLGAAPVKIRGAAPANVPEPGTIFLIGSVLLGMISFRQKIRK